MADSDEGSGSGSEDESGSSVPSSTADHGSRFDEFHRRLDERDSKREQAGQDTGAERRPDPRSATGPKPNEHEEAVKPDADGWVWGSSKETATTDEGGTPDNADDPASGESGYELAEPESDESGIEPAKSESDDGRLWNEREINRLDVGTGDDDSSPDRPEDSVADPTKADPSSADDTSAGTAQSEPGSEVHEGADERTEQIQVDRWAGLGSDIRGGGTSNHADKAAEPTDPVAGPGETVRGATVEGDEQESLDGVLTGESGAGDTRLSGPSFHDTSLSDEVDRAVSGDSVLVLGPTGHSVSDVICSKFLIGEEGSRDVLFVTFDQSSSERIDVCHRADEWAGGEIGVVEVGRGGRNAAASEITGGTVGSITVRHVSRPGDLSKLGIVITQLLSEFSGTSRRTVLCIHTLSALHNHVGTRTLFRFLNTLQGRLRSENAVGHYHMDPDLHDEIVIETLRPVFGSVVRFSADGTLEVE